MGAIVGLTVGVFSLSLELLKQPRLPYYHLTPMQQLSVTPGWQQFLFVFLVVLIGPTIEEMMYRGILYGGYRESLGATWAAICTTAIFVSLHFAYIIPFPYKIIGVTTSAIAFLWCRLKWSAIGPAVAAHAVYNCMMALYPSWH